MIFSLCHLTKLKTETFLNLFIFDIFTVSNLSPDGGDPGLVSEEGVHGDAVLDDEGGDGDERQHQHVQDEELLAAGGGGVDAVAAHLPHRVRHALHQHTGQWSAHGHHQHWRIVSSSNRGVSLNDETMFRQTAIEQN